MPFRLDRNAKLRRARKRFSIKEGDAGVIVVKIDPASKAFEAGIRPGDMVTQINQKDIATIEDYKKAS